MNDAERRVALLRRMAWAGVALVLTITSLSAFLRLKQAGLGCAEWPACYGRTLLEPPAAMVVAGGDTMTIVARFAHRVAASAAGLLVLVMAMVSLAPRPRLWREARLTLALLACAVFLAVLGRWTAGARVPAVAMGNVLIGFAMLALCWRLARTSGTTRGTERRPSRLLAWIAIALVLGQIALGVLASASLAGLSCPDLLRCDVGAGAWQGLDPWRDPASAVSARSDGALVSVLHRVGAVVLAVVLAALAFAAWRHGRRGTVAAMLTLLGLQLALGAGLVIAGLPLAPAVAHNLVAALLLAVVCDLFLGARHRRER